MKKLIILAALFAAALTADAEERTKTYRFGDIENIRAGYTYKVYVTKGSSKAIKVVYDSELEKYMKVGYSAIQSMLTLQMEELPRKLQREEFAPVEVYINMDDIKNINLSGAAAIYFEGEYRTDDLEIDLSGASNLQDLRISGHEASIECSGAAQATITGIFDGDVEIDCSGAANVHFNGKGHRFEGDFSGASDFRGELTFEQNSIECSGASKIDIYGSGESVRLEGSGACNVDAKGFIANNVTVDLSGACKARVHARKVLRYDVSRACKMTYYGDAELINTSEESNIIRGSF